MINTFEAAYRLLNHGETSLETKQPSFRDKLDLFFVDYELVPMIVHENYLSSMQSRSTDSDIENMATAAEFISEGDVLHQQLRTEMDWALLANIGICSSVAPCLLLSGTSEYPGYPQYLSKQGSIVKSKRLLREVKATLGH